MRVPLWSIPLASILGVAVGLVCSHRDIQSYRGDAPDTKPSLTLTIHYDPDLPEPLKVCPERYSDAKVSYTYKDRDRCLKVREAILDLLHADYAREY